MELFENDRSMHGRKADCFHRETCDRANSAGSESRLFCINTWAMIWPSDYRDYDYHPQLHADTALELEPV
jgi:hypothetical protein